MNSDTINWTDVSRNSSDLEYLTEHFKNLDYADLSENRHAGLLLIENPGFIDWYRLELNYYCNYIKYLIGITTEAAAQGKYIEDIDEIWETLIDTEDL